MQNPNPERKYLVIESRAENEDGLPSGVVGVNEFPTSKDALDEVARVIRTGNDWALFEWTIDWRSYWAPRAVIRPGLEDARIS